MFLQPHTPKRLYAANVKSWCNCFSLYILHNLNCLNSSERDRGVLQCQTISFHKLLRVTQNNFAASTIAGHKIEIVLCGAFQLTKSPTKDPECCCFYCDQNKSLRVYYPSPASFALVAHLQMN